MATQALPWISPTILTCERGPVEICLPSETHLSAAVRATPADALDEQADDGQQS
jgi:hypothetical protein